MDNCCVQSFLHCFYMPFPLSWIFALIHKQLWSILLPSIHLPLHLQLISTLKIYWIISRGTLLPSTDLCQGDRRPHSGSVTRFVLCRENAVRLNVIARHIINIFLMESHTTWEVVAVWYFSIMNLWREWGFIKYLANGTYCMFVSYFYISSFSFSSWSNKWTDHSTSITKIFVVSNLQVAESMPDTKRQRIGLSWRTKTALEKKSAQDTSILSELYIQLSAGGINTLTQILYILW